jgi:hypothetical protein
MCCRPNQHLNVLTVIDKLTLDDYHKNVFKVRYMPLLRQYRRRAFMYAAMFHIMRAVVTVGSITVPALLSLTTGTTWLTWSISLAVSICNGVLTLFKIDKKYYSLHTTMHILETEGWQYISLAGKYSKQRDQVVTPFTNSHKYQFIYFCLAIEKIKMLQVQEEYWKAQEEKEKTGTNSSSATGNQSIVPQTASPQKAGSNEEVLSWIQSIVEDSKKKAAEAKNEIVPPPAEEKTDV